ncbi:MAG: N-acetyltransferase [Allomuricauda sp.]|nr:MAG: N-acetyltransferase [Allomuricauda sp.]
MTNSEILISTDKSLLDVEKIHLEIKSSYWGGYRSKALTQKTIDNSICYGVYQANEQIGFARVLTDEVVYAHIMDVIIFGNHKGRGIGKKLMDHIMADPKFQNVLTIGLKTKDAHSFYERYGFTAIGDSVLWMTIDNAKLD